jgi:hypothetical protein
MSASENGLYPEVQSELPQFLAALARQDPQDQVAVIVFGNRDDTRTIYPMGPPTPNIPLPGDANSLGTDIGYAFQLGLQQLSLARKNIQLGDVLLLSDGGMWAPNDPTYDAGRRYHAPGWATLRSNVQGLGIPVTGYGLPLTRNVTDIDALDQALTACFGGNQQMLSANFSDLTAQLDGTQGKVQDSRIAVASAPDSGRGVQVTWKEPATSDGALRLDLPRGKANLSVRLTATTRHIPLHVRRRHRTDLRRRYRTRARPAGYPACPSELAARDRRLRGRGGRAAFLAGNAHPQRPRVLAVHQRDKEILPRQVLYHR